MRKRKDPYPMLDANDMATELPIAAGLDADRLLEMSRRIKQLAGRFGCEAFEVLVAAIELEAAQLANPTSDGEKVDAVVASALNVVRRRHGLTGRAL